MNAATPRCVGERGRQRRGSHITVRGHEESGRHPIAKGGLQLSRRITIEQRMRHTDRAESPRSRRENRCLGFIEGDLQCPATAVFDRSLRVVLDSPDEIVVHRQAARGQVAKRGNVSFDLWSENTG